MNQNVPMFWRDERLPFVELRKVDDGRDIHYAPHSHKQWSIGAITGGNSSFVYREDAFDVRDGDLVMMNPEWMHACNPVENQPWSYLMLYLDTSWLTQLRYDAGLLTEQNWQDISTAVISDPGWYQRYNEVADCLMDAQRELLEKQTLVIAFLVDLMTSLDGHESSLPSAIPEALQQVAGRLRDRATEEISLEDLCQLSNYSQGHLIRLFKRHFGLTPHAYQINCRIQLGQQDLKQGKAIAETAVDAGFSDQPHFQRTFKKLVAATPSQYQKNSLKH